MLINCMKCKKKQEITQVEYEVVDKTGAYRAKGTCPVCHGKVGVFVGESALPPAEKTRLKPLSDKIKAAKKSKSGAAEKKKSKPKAKVAKK